MSNIRGIMDQLVIVESAITITDPTTIAATDTRAYKFVPPANAQISDKVAWFNSYTLSAIHRTVNLRRTLWDIRVLLFVYDADFDQAVDIVSAMLDAFLNDLDSHITLGGIVSSTEIRGGSPTLQALEHGQRVYAGVEVHLDVAEVESRSYS